MVAGETEPFLPQERGAKIAEEQGLKDLAKVGNEVAEQIKAAKPAPASPQLSFRQRQELSTDEIAKQMAEKGKASRTIALFVVKREAEEKNR